MINSPIIPVSTSTGTTSNSEDSRPQLEKPSTNAEETLSAKEAQLDIMWDKIQELKLTDPFAAQVLYVRYKRLAGELPPPTPQDIA